MESELEVRESAPWAAEQDSRGIPSIEQTHLARKRNGEVVEVNRFDFNLAMCAKDFRKHIQVSDLTWGEIGWLTLLTANEQVAEIAKQVTK